MSSLTPMMEQYRRMKEEAGDALLFFRLGDFYEMFFEDAEVGARELELVLTGRDGGGVRVPMCGVPAQAVDTYVNRLVQKGYRVAICEQVEDPAKARGLVRRAIVRIVTPGTVLDGQWLDATANNFLCAVASVDGVPGLAAVDISTGDFLVSQFRPGSLDELLDGLARLLPRECLLGPAIGSDPALRAALGRFGTFVTERPAAAFEPAQARRRLLEHFGVSSLHGFGCEGMTAAVSAAGALLDYLQETQRAALPHLTDLRVVTYGEEMLLDAATRRNLELTQSLRDGGRQGSLLDALDATVTAMGSRVLRRWVEAPLRRREPIEERLDAVEYFVRRPRLRAAVRRALDGVYDLERLQSRIACATAGPRELVALRRSLEALPTVRSSLSGDGELPALLARLAAALAVPSEPAALIARALVDDPPAAVAEGGVIREGFDPELDRLRQESRAGKAWVAELEARERERTGIRSLKVGYNKVFGYYIEVTHANRDLVPDDYVRRQTLAGAERYVTPELKEREEAILTAEERAAALELQHFVAVREAVARHTVAVQAAARSVGALDALAALAEVAATRGYVRPVVDEGLALVVEEGRHPVLEQSLGPHAFVPNDARLDGEGDRFLVVTGPNMAGKSTFARQIALIVLMAQMGSFVPARSCRVGLVDRVFTRIGAGDDIAGGRSTFMVEMQEVANILRNATERSLVVLDEVGRGTSTFDGLSIAWAVSEDLYGRVRARTIFTTHYHELTALEDLLPGVRNLTVAVRERDGGLVFLHRVVPGRAARSYGVEVARLAGLPAAVVERARE
ncbi:MAG: DNA mismatch repair protein MutS, partial [Clostridia bacterium]|nr:DNA mismatch repair protein MutS [Clostridia bacterium]